jgi:hypothetical protein
MSDLDSYAPGDVLPNGDIVVLYYSPGDDPTLPPTGRRPMSVGEVWVTSEQAEKALIWGWQRSDRESQNGLVAIKRGGY